MYTVKARNLKFYLGYTDMDCASDNVTTLPLSYRTPLIIAIIRILHTHRQWLYKLKISAKTRVKCAA